MERSEKDTQGSESNGWAQGLTTIANWLKRGIKGWSTFCTKGRWLLITGSIVLPGLYLLLAPQQIANRDTLTVQMAGAGIIIFGIGISPPTLLHDTISRKLKSHLFTGSDRGNTFAFSIYCISIQNSVYLAMFILAIAGSVLLIRSLNPIPNANISSASMMYVLPHLAGVGAISPLTVFSMRRYSEGIKEMFAILAELRRGEMSPAVKIPPEQRSEPLDRDINVANHVPSNTEEKDNEAGAGGIKELLDIIDKFKGGPQ